MHGEDPGGSPFDPKFAWNNGFEAWCGIEGDYVTIWRELGARAQENPTKVCTLGVIAEDDSKYIAGKIATNTMFDTASLTVNQGQTAYINVMSLLTYKSAHLTAASQIMLRQKPGNELDFVAIDGGSTQIVASPTNKTPLQ